MSTTVHIDDEMKPFYCVSSLDVTDVTGVTIEPYL